MFDIVFFFKYANLLFQIFPRQMNLSSLGPDQIQLNHGLQLLAIKVGKVYIHFVVGKLLTRKTKHSHLKLSKVNQTKTSF